MNNFIKDNIYYLKKEYGVTVNLIKKTDSVDVTTGVIAETKSVYPVEECIALPNRLTYMFVDKGVPIGIKNRTVIIDKQDLQVEIDKSDFIQIDNKQYAIKDIDDYYDALLVIIQETDGVSTP